MITTRTGSKQTKTSQLDEKWTVNMKQEENIGRIYVRRQKPPPRRSSHLKPWFIVKIKLF